MFIWRIYEWEDWTKYFISYVKDTFNSSKYIWFAISIPNFIIIRITYIFGYINPWYKKLGLTLFHKRIV